MTSFWDILQISQDCSLSSRVDTLLELGDPLGSVLRCIGPWELLLPLLLSCLHNGLHKDAEHQLCCTGLRNRTQYFRPEAESLWLFCQGAK